MEDPTLNYIALGVMIFVVVVLFYGIIAIHDIPYRNCRIPRSSASGCDTRRGVGEPVHAPCPVAISMDLGHGLPPRARLGFFP